MWTTIKEKQMNGKINEAIKKVSELSKRLLPQNNNRYIEKKEFAKGIIPFY